MGPRSQQPRSGNCHWAHGLHVTANPKRNGLVSHRRPTWSLPINSEGKSRMPRCEQKAAGAVSLISLENLPHKNVDDDVGCGVISGKKRRRQKVWSISWWCQGTVDSQSGRDRRFLSCWFNPEGSIAHKWLPAQNLWDTTQGQLLSKCGLQV